MSDSLQQSGVLGMRWGHRKSGTSSTGPPSADHATVASIRKKKLHEMSNDEINKLVTRTNLENQYKSLRPDKTSAGKKYVAGILAQSGRQALTPLVASGMTAAAGLLVKKIISMAKSRATAKAANGLAGQIIEGHFK